MAAEEPDHAAQASEHLELADRLSDILQDHALIMHKLEIAFVHALAGHTVKAHHALGAAEAELAKYEPPYSREHDVALAKAKVHAALAHVQRIASRR